MTTATDHDRPHPWQSAYDDFWNRTLPYLRDHGKDIGARSQAGDEVCQRVINEYALLVKSFDPMTYDSLVRALDAYKASHAEEKRQ